LIVVIKGSTVKGESEDLFSVYFFTSIMRSSAVPIRSFLRVDTIEREAFHHIDAFEIPLAKILTPAIIHSTKFFPKQFRQKFSPGLSQKIFPAHAMNARFAIFRKCRIAPFARIPVSNPRLMDADPESKPVSASPLLPIHLTSALSGFKAGMCAGV